MSAPCPLCGKPIEVAGGKLAAHVVRFGRVLGGQTRCAGSGTDAAEAIRIAAEHRAIRNETKKRRLLRTKSGR